jgi:hypothetical protein
MTAPTSVEGQGARPELPPTLVALDRARAAAAAWSFTLREWAPLSRALEQLRTALWERERQYPATIRTTRAGALRLVREAIAMVEAEHLSPECRSVVVAIVAEAQGLVESLAGHAPTVPTAQRAEQC